MTQLKRTSLYNEYKKLGAKVIDFGGWEMPVQFSSILHEHDCTRKRASLFDVSHMGEIIISGKDSLSFLQKLVTNDVSKLTKNKVQYAFMCNEYGGIIDDFLIYMLNDDRYMLVVNATNVEKDLTWLQKQSIHYDKVKIQDMSSELSLLALQGPFAAKIIDKVTDEHTSEMMPFTCKQYICFKEINAKALVSRTGYTGEDGFEIYMSNEHSCDLWNLLLRQGTEDWIKPAGLGARDTLRLEAGLPLYGQELTEFVTPIEAGLSFAVKLSKAEFIGRDVLQKQVEQGTLLKNVGIEMIDKGIPRTDYIVFSEEGYEIGVITSGTQSPSLKKAIGLARIDRKYSEIGTIIFVEIRKRKRKAKIVDTPFYRRT